MTLMYYAFAKANHAVAKDSRKIVRTCALFHWRKLVKAPGKLGKSLQNQCPRKLAKVLLCRMQRCEGQNASRESVAKGTCERRSPVEQILDRC